MKYGLDLMESLKEVVETYMPVNYLHGLQILTFGLFPMCG